MTVRKIIDAKDHEGNLVFPKTHAKAVYFSNGKTVEEGYVNPIVDFTGSYVMLQPNKYYRTGVVESLSIELADPEDTTIENQYAIEFVSGSTATNLILPASIKWHKGNSPSIEPNTTYQISIVNNLGVCGAFPVIE